jgi:hypothetical protein
MIDFKEVVDNRIIVKSEEEFFAEYEKSRYVREFPGHEFSITIYNPPVEVESRIYRVHDDLSLELIHRTKYI